MVNSDIRDTLHLAAHLVTLPDGDEAKPQIAIAHQLSRIVDELYELRLELKDMYTHFSQRDSG